ncbi:MAG TPA: hypothetical protein VMX97_02230 [Hyphomicrobiaceae bacterium]|nr:hypothetical protein [Hyphomicrobiaceae bacterium]
MNAPSLSDLRNANGNRPISDEKMDQIRDLLFGDFTRQNEARLMALEERVKALELLLQRRLDALQVRLDAVSAEADATQRQALDEIARGIQDLGTRIKNIAVE